jgi:hypothetical protein
MGTNGSHFRSSTLRLEKSDEKCTKVERAGFFKSSAKETTFQKMMCDELICCVLLRF